MLFAAGDDGVTLTMKSELVWMKHVFITSHKTVSPSLLSADSARENLIFYLMGFA